MNKFRKFHRNLRFWAVCMTIMVLALIGLGLAAALSINPFYCVACLGVVPFLGAVIPEAEFQEKVLRGVEGLQKEQGEQKSRVDKVLGDLDRADKEVKKALDELTQVKNHCNDFDTTLKKMQQVQKAIALNARSSFRDPVERCLANDEVRFYLNAVARYAHYLRSGSINLCPAEMRKVVEEGNASIKSLTGVDTSLGQATVPQQTFNEIYDTLLEYGDWPSLGVIRVGMRTTVLPVALTRPAFYWIGSGTGGSGEGTAITEGAFTGSSVNVVIQTLAAYLTVARELLADSTVDLSGYILRQMAQTISYGMDHVSFAADATADQTDAGYRGIFFADAANVKLKAEATAGNTTVKDLDLEDFVNCLTTVNPIVLKRSARWWMHPQILAKMVLIRDSNKRPIFQTWQEVPRPGGIGSILGYPVTPTAVAPSTDAAGNPIAVFGDPDGMAVGIRSDLELATSDDIKFAENMRAYRALIRAGVIIKTATGSDTLKPFAVLKTPAQ